MSPAPGTQGSPQPPAGEVRPPTDLASTLKVTPGPTSLGDAVLEDLGLDSQPQQIRPTDEVELARWLRDTPAGHGLVAVGAATGQCGGRPPRRVDLLLDLTGMHDVLEHSVEDFVVTVQAGTRLRVLQKHLAESRQWLPVESPDAGRATLGGMIAGAAPSALAASLGNLRAHLLGLKFVRGDGVVARAGGKVVKNVSGYDLMKLMHGSLGTLGIVTEATFRTRPRPARDVVGIETSDDLAEALRTADRWAAALDQDPAALLVHGRIGQGPMQVLIRLQGATPAVEDQIGRSNGARFEDARTGEADLPTDWQSAIRVLSRGDRPGTWHVRFAFRPERRHEVVAPLYDLARTFGRPMQITVDFLRGVGWLHGAPQETRTPAATAEDARHFEELRSKLREQGARCQLEAGPLATRIAQLGAGRTATIHALQERIRQAFDPKGILAPGRLTPEDA